MNFSEIEQGLKCLPNRSATFIEPMECLAVTKIPGDLAWVYEIKLDGYRAVSVTSAGRLNLYSRRRNSFNRQYSIVHGALADLPDNTVVDGEVVALDDSGRPDFKLLRHYRTQRSRIHYFGFDLLVYQNRDLTLVPLIERREILKSLTFSSPRIRIAEYFEASAADMLSVAPAQGLEGSLRSERTVATSRGDTRSSPFCVRTKQPVPPRNGDLRLSLQRTMFHSTASLTS